MMQHVCDICQSPIPNGERTTVEIDRGPHVEQARTSRLDLCKDCTAALEEYINGQKLIIEARSQPDYVE